MTTKYTEGPWSVAETRHNYDTVIRGPRGEPIALTLIAGYTKKEGNANSALLAAAPDLLEALKWMVLRTEEGGYPDGKCLEEARAAIAKATGESE